MNESPYISVIVPVYKAESYLHRCVDSLLAQTFQEYEILLINDGSPDGSGEICNAYARQDKRVRVFHKENGGVSSARQYGMEHALGEYIIHADPDDWVEPTMLTELYAKAKETDVDMVICDFFVDEKENESRIVIQKPSSLDAETVCRELFQHLHGSCWNKLLRKECCEYFGIRFPLGLSYCEDLYVNARLLSKKIRVAYLAKAFYHYDQYINADSLVHRSSEFILKQGRCLREYLRKDLPKNLFNKIYPYLLYNQSMNVLGDSQPYLDDFISDFKDLKSYLTELRVSRKSKMLLRIALYVSPTLAHCLYVGWNRIHV